MRDYSLSVAESENLTGNDLTSTTTVWVAGVSGRTGAERNVTRNRTLSSTTAHSWTWIYTATVDARLTTRAFSIRETIRSAAEFTQTGVAWQTDAFGL